MSDYSAGKEILSYCNKCKLTLGHVIVVMKNSTTIGKVECQTCKSVHSYKDPSTVNNKKKSPVRAKKAPASSVSVSDLWMDAISKATTKSQPYSIKSKYVVGDIIDHPKFGPGIVEKCFDATKIEVMFRHNIRTLMHNIK